MVWSVSTAKMFDRCQRQWFYKRHFASARSKDETRRKAYLLGKLESISGWRGSLVDRVLSLEVIPALERGEEVSEVRTLASAMARFDLTRRPRGNWSSPRSPIRLSHVSVGASSADVCIRGLVVCAPCALRPKRA